MKCEKCSGNGQIFMVDRVMRDQDYGPSTEGHYENCLMCNGKGEVRPYNMTEQEVLQVLGKVGAVIVDSHIVYTSGLHGTAYINKDAVYPHVELTSRLCRAIAEHFSSENHYGIDTVVAPAVGGVILSTWTAHWLEQLTGRKVLALYAEHHDEIFIFRRGYAKFIPERRVLVVEDVLNTGHSAKKVVEATRAIGGKVIGVGVLCNRGGVTSINLGNVPELFTLTNVNMDAWSEESCAKVGPCSKDIPINTEIGKGREFLARK